LSLSISWCLLEKTEVRRQGILLTGNLEESTTVPTSICSLYLVIFAPTAF